MRSVIEMVTTAKSPITMIFVMLFFSIANAQPITGIGDFKIGMSIIEFINSPEIREKTIKESSEGNILSRLTDKNIVWKTDHKTQTEDFLRIFSPDITKYEFIISLGAGEIVRQSIKATFYEGILVEVEIMRGFSSSHLEILKKKYGEPKVADSMKKVVCQNGYGAKFERNEGSVIYIWGLGNPISASALLSSSECGKRVSFFYSVSDRAKRTLARDTEEDLKRAHEEELEKQKAASSKL